MFQDEYIEKIKKQLNDIHCILQQKNDIQYMDYIKYQKYKYEETLFIFGDVIGLANINNLIFLLIEDDGRFYIESKMFYFNETFGFDCMKVFQSFNDNSNSIILNF